MIIQFDKKLTIISTIFFISVFIFTQIGNRCVTEIARDQFMYTPLPDVYHNALPESMRQWHEYSDWIPITPLVLFILLDRFEHAGEFLLMIGIIYLIRAISFNLTVLPAPHPECKCEWEDEPETFLRSLLNILYQESCNDLIFSGHTSMMLMSSLFLAYYCVPNSILAKLFLIFFNIMGVLVIIGTKLHYGVDCWLACIINTLLFFAFHPPPCSNCNH